jgi:hypothetical protein
MLKSRSDLLRLVSRESGSNPIVAQALGGVMLEGTALLGAYLEARIQAGELRPHDVTVPARALFWSIITLHLSGATSDGFESALVGVLLQGISAS